MEFLPEFKSELNSFTEARLPISNSRIKQLTQYAILAVTKYKHIVREIETFIKKSENSQLMLPTVYLMDSIIHESRGLFKDKDVYVPRFSSSLKSIFQKIFMICSPEDMDKIVRVIKLWRKTHVFPTKMLNSILKMAKPVKEEQTSEFPVSHSTPKPETQASPVQIKTVPDSNDLYAIPTKTEQSPFKVDNSFEDKQIHDNIIDTLILPTASHVETEPKKTSYSNEHLAFVHSKIKEVQSKRDNQVEDKPNDTSPIPSTTFQLETEVFTVLTKTSSNSGVKEMDSDSDEFFVDPAKTQQSSNFKMANGVKVKKNCWGARPGVSATSQIQIESKETIEMDNCLNESPPTNLSPPRQLPINFNWTSANPFDDKQTIETSPVPSKTSPIEAEVQPESKKTQNMDHDSTESSASVKVAAENAANALKSLSNLINQRENLLVAKLDKMASIVKLVKDSDSMRNNVIAQFLPQFPAMLSPMIPASFVVHPPPDSFQQQYPSYINQNY